MNPYQSFQITIYHHIAAWSLINLLVKPCHFSWLNHPGDHLPCRPRTSPAGHRHTALVGSGCAGAAGRHATLRLREAFSDKPMGLGVKSPAEIHWMSSLVQLIWLLEMDTHTHTYIHACMHACTHAYIHVYIHTYIYTCMHPCIHTYIHTGWQMGLKTIAT